MRVLPLLLVLLLSAIAGCGGSAGGEVPSQPAAAAATSPPPTGSTPRAPLRYAVLGDSYSNGQSAGAEHAWPAVMAAQLTKDGLATQVVANPSVTGATTAEMLSTGLDPIRRAAPDVMTVMLGVNDQVQGHTLAQFAADEARAIDAAIDITGSSRRVIAVDIPDYSVSPAGAQFGDPSSTTKTIDAFNAVIRKTAARRHVRLVSIVDLSRALGADGIGIDGLHPSSAQLARWASRIEPIARQQWDQLPAP